MADSKGDGVDGRSVRLHQVHRAKLATNVSAEVLSCWLLWQQWLVPGLLVRVIPPALASTLVLRGDLEPLAQTARGRYVLEHMPPSAHAVRAVGDVVTAWGAWRRHVPTVAVGAVMIAAGWSRGLRPPRRPAETRPVNLGR